MFAAWRSFSGTMQRVFRFLVLFVIARLAVGLGIIAFDREQLAWGIEATLITLAAVAVCMLLAFALRRRFPPGAVDTGAARLS